MAAIRCEMFVNLHFSIVISWINHLKSIPNFPRPSRNLTWARPPATKASTSAASEASAWWVPWIYLWSSRTKGRSTAVFWEENPNNGPSMCQSYEVVHFGTFFGVATLSPHVMLAEETCFRSCWSCCHCSRCALYSAFLVHGLLGCQLECLNRATAAHGEPGSQSTETRNSSAFIFLRLWALPSWCPPGVLSNWGWKPKGPKAQRLKGSKAQRPMRNLGMWGAKTTTKMFRVKLDSAKWNANRMLRIQSWGQARTGLQWIQEVAAAEGK